jgi:hypothetical protein
MKAELGNLAEEPRNVLKDKTLRICGQVRLDLRFGATICLKCIAKGKTMMDNAKIIEAAKCTAVTAVPLLPTPCR